MARRHSTTALFGSVVRCLLVARASWLGLLLALPAAAVPDVGFPDGVASGDVTTTRAVLWTRVDRDLPVKVEVSTDPSFVATEVFKQTVQPDGGLVAKALATPLEPGTTYYFRWRHGSAESPVGTFRTPPAPEVAADVRFVFTADSDGLQRDFVDGNLFEVLQAAQAEDPDFFVYLGDTIYSDSSLRPLAGLTPAAQTLEEYRAAYRFNRTFQNLRELLRATSTYAIWDDHEVQNDYDGQTVDATRYANGRRAFVENMPLLEVDLPEDATCAGDPLFRVFHWGAGVDVFILDERSCRSADVQAACATSAQTVDLAPTMPDLGPPGSGLDFRNQFRQQLLAATGNPTLVNLLLPAVPLPQCVAALNDPTRTVLGPVQKAAFKDALQASTASLKVIVNEYPIQQFYALPYDRWEGFAAERTELLNFIRTQVSGRKLFVTTDTHATMINDVSVDRFLAPAPVAPEVVTGPISTFTFEEELVNFAGGLGLPPAFVVAAFHQILTLSGVDCRNLDTDSYALVETNAAAGTTTVTTKDASRNLVRNADPFAPGSTQPCTITIGP